jgi:CubicO group peptidase (beta-lactamase class C family)
MKFPAPPQIVRTALLLAAMCLPAFADVAPPSFPSDGGIAAKLKPFVENDVIPGAVVLVADKDKILDLETVGYSDVDKKTPMEVNDLFMIASMSKTITSVGLMMMVDEGKVSLDDPVEKYLPAFKGQMVADQHDPTHPHPPKHPITVREVMSHTSGIQKGFHIKNPTSATDAANQIATQPLDWEPGTRYLYSEGPIIGGAIIEVTSGMPYPQFIQQRILDPLGMKDTTAWPNAEQASRLAFTGQINPSNKKLENRKGNEIYVNDPARCAPVPPRVMSQMTLEVISDYKNHYARPSGGWFSTALDFSKFSRMLLNGGTYEGKRYLTPASLKEMSTIQTGNFFPGNTEGYGLGTFIQKNPSEDGPSVGSYGHRGSRKTFFWIDPTNELVLIFMTQRADNLTKQEQKALNIAFIKTAIEKYGKTSKSAEAQTSAASR